jgi:glycosyltransferase involved in cell wall biosynthesis
LIVPAVAKMAERGADISLITFEKPSDWSRERLVAETAARLRSSGVDWSPYRYHKAPRIPATMFDILSGWWRGVRVGLRSRAQLVHGRTFVGGLIGRAVASTLRVPFIYHAEGFYPDEMVDGGFWRRDSFAHRTAKNLDLGLFARARGVIVLSERAKAILAASRLPDWAAKPVAVVPSAIDVDRFSVHAIAPLPGRVLRFVHLGGVGGRYRLDAAIRFIRVAQAHRPVRLEVLSGALTLASEILAQSGLPDDAWSVRSVAPAEVPNMLAGCDAGFALLVEGLSEVGGSPTKVGEYWASGMPVITTTNVGDVGDIVQRERVGVILREDSDSGHEAALKHLLDLLAEPGLPARCRLAAEVHYGLDAAMYRQLRLYEAVLGAPRQGRTDS